MSATIDSCCPSINAHPSGWRNLDIPVRHMIHTERQLLTSSTVFFWYWDSSGRLVDAGRPVRLNVESLSCRLNTPTLPSRVSVNMTDRQHAGRAATVAWKCACSNDLRVLGYCRAQATSGGLYGCRKLNLNHCHHRFPSSLPPAMYEFVERDIMGTWSRGRRGGSKRADDGTHRSGRPRRPRDPAYKLVQRQAHLDFYFFFRFQLECIHWIYRNRVFP